MALAIQQACKNRKNDLRVWDVPGRHDDSFLTKPEANAKQGNSKFVSDSRRHTLAE